MSAPAVVDQRAAAWLAMPQPDRRRAIAAALRGVVYTISPLTLEFPSLLNLFGLADCHIRLLYVPDGVSYRPGLGLRVLGLADPVEASYPDQDAAMSAALRALGPCLDRAITDPGAPFDSHQREAALVAALRWSASQAQAINLEDMP